MIVVLPAQPLYFCPFESISKRNYTMAPFTKPIWSGPNPYRTTVRTKFGYVNGTFRYQKFGPDLGPDKAGPAYVQGPRSDRIWSGTKCGYVNAPSSSDQAKCLTFGGKSQMANRQRGANWSNDETWVIIRIWSL